jgi:hypothetical protein
MQSGRDSGYRKRSSTLQTNGVRFLNRQDKNSAIFIHNFQFKITICVMM